MEQLPDNGTNLREQITHPVKIVQELGIFGILPNLQPLDKPHDLMAVYHCILNEFTEQDGLLRFAVLSIAADHLLSLLDVGQQELEALRW